MNVSLGLMRDVAIQCQINTEPDRCSKGTQYAPPPTEDSESEEEVEDEDDTMADPDYNFDSDKETLVDYDEEQMNNETM